MFTAFAWWRKKQPVRFQPAGVFFAWRKKTQPVRFQPAVFLLNILEGRMFLVISC